MISTKKAIRQLLVFFLFLMIFLSSNAQKLNPYSAPSLVGDSIMVGKSVNVTDTIFLNDQLKTSIAATKQIDNLVSLVLFDIPPAANLDTFSIQIDLKIDLTDSSMLVHSVSSSLIINYSKKNIYKNKAVAFFQNMIGALVTVEKITVTNAAQSEVMKYCRLDNTISIDRIFNSDCNINKVSNLYSDPSFINGTGELKVFWPSKTFVDAYDLEWTFIDKAALEDGFYNNSAGSLDKESIFKNNNTRVTVFDVTYNIPMLFEGDGSLFYRVRTVQKGANDEIISGPWSSETDNGLGRYDFTGHETALNWQATTTFAEGGKRKSVVTYYDGSLKARQIVTKDNSTQTTIVAETFYDKQGKPAIQVLPAPTISNLIKYSPLFNTTNGGEYNKEAYDPDFLNDCGSQALSMDNTTGSSNYYSSSNPDKSGSAQFIPDAKNYPFSQIKYTNDNTGRIEKQGGVGPEMQIGQGNHAAEYYYGVPEQASLDALFGTEAGDASHYAKNMVKDANGQLSVSYIDMNGKTVATALAGKNPASLLKLNNYREDILTENLLSASNNIITGNSIHAARSILVPVAGDYQFSYGMPAESLTLEDCQKRNICYDCLYDLNITVSNNCDAPIVFKKSNFQLYQVDTTCKEATPINLSFTLPLLIGSYDITKELTISKYGLQYYRDSLFIEHNTCQTYDELLKEQLDIIKSKIDCTPESETYNFLDKVHEEMLADLTPGSGQYASFPVDRCRSIFDKQIITGFYQFQLVPDYKDAFGNPDYVMNSNGLLVTPGMLSPEEFIANFKSSWAESLLRYHPEYKLYQAYLDYNLKDDYTWVQDFNATNSFGEAIAKGYLTPTGNGPSIVSLLPRGLRGDPLFGHPFAYGARLEIESKLSAFINDGQQNYSAWGLANGLIKCSDNSNNCWQGWDRPDKVFNTTLLCTGELDQAWRNFRSFYASIRADWVDKYTRQNAGPLGQICSPVFPQANDVLNTAGYIGDPSGDHDKAASNLSDFLDANCNAYSLRWFQQLAPCNYTNADTAIILKYLRQVCREGADVDHLFGSSSVNPSSSLRFRSFDDVIKFYNDSAYNGQIDHNLCNAYLIDKPLPFNVSRPAVSQNIFKKPSDCQCATINNIFLEYRKYAIPAETFSGYLLRIHHTSIRQSTLDSLRALCDGSITCTYLSNPISLPLVLQCNQQEQCVTCNVVLQYKNNFIAEFPSLIPSALESDMIQQQTNRLFANYMNSHLGFSNSTIDYLDFLDSCSKTHPLDGDSLRGGYADFVDQYFNRKNLSDSGRYVDFYMTTFEGNRTPDEGPKGVFTPSGIFLGNTVDGSIDEIKSSFVIIWNSSSENQHFGTLELLPNGKFRLHQKIGIPVPCNGITGMRFYQFNTPNTLLDAVLTGPGSFVDFGDGDHVISNPSNQIPESIFHWKGTISTDWNDPQNWLPESVPGQANDVIIDGTNKYSPVIYGHSQQINNLTITSGDSLTINGQSLRISGSINNQGILNASGGSVELNSFQPQIIAPGTFTGKVVNDLIISNTSKEGVTLQDTVEILNSLSFGNVKNATLNTGGLLVIKSNANNTGRIADETNGGINSGNNIIGDVTVEKYFSPIQFKGWKNMSSGVTTSTSIHANWQEGAKAWNDNPHPGYGIHISGSTIDQFNGFDKSINGSSSLKFYDNINDRFIPIANTNVLTLNALQAYELYIRGDRTINIQVRPEFQTSTTTTLRATGKIVQGPVTYSAGLSGINDPSGGSSFLANPYASPISWPKVYAENTGIANYYTFLDPSINSTPYVSVGEYITVDVNGVTSNPLSKATVDIPGSQAFFIQASNVIPPSITIRETDKSTSNNIKIFKPYVLSQAFYTSLFVNDSLGRRNADAVLHRFGDNYSNDLDYNDAKEMENEEENIAISRLGKHLSIESRAYPSGTNDTIPIFMSHMKAKEYEFEFKPMNFELPGMNAFLIDKFTTRQYSISFDTLTTISFSIDSNEISSFDSNRFLIILTPNGPHKSIATLENKLPESIPAAKIVNTTTNVGSNIYPMPAGNYNFPSGSAYYITHNYATAGLHTVTVYHSDTRGTLGFDNWGASGTNLSNISNLRGYVPNELLHVMFHSTQDSSLNTFSKIKNKDSITKVRMVHFISGDGGVTPILNYNFGSLAKNHDLHYININIPDTRLADVLPDMAGNFPKLEGLIVNANMYTDDVQFNLPNAKYLIIQNGLKSYQVDNIINQIALGSLVSNGQMYLRFGNEPRTVASDAAVSNLQSRGWRVFTNDTAQYVPPISVNFNDSFSYEQHQYSLFSNYFNNRFGMDLTETQWLQLFIDKTGSAPDPCPSVSSSANRPGTTAAFTSMGPLLCGRTAIDSAIDINMDPCRDTSTTATKKALYLYDIRQKFLKSSFENQYTAKCLNAVNLETFTVTHAVSEYQYTLYYYDQA